MAMRNQLRFSDALIVSDVALGVFQMACDVVQINSNILRQSRLYQIIFILLFFSILRFCGRTFGKFFTEMFVGYDLIERFLHVRFQLMRYSKSLSVSLSAGMFAVPPRVCLVLGLLMMLLVLVGGGGGGGG